MKLAKPKNDAGQKGIWDHLYRPMPPPWRRDIAWLDCETTGLDPKKHVIIEIACIRSDGEMFETKIKPSAKDLANMSDQARAVNGYNDREWSDAPDWGDVAPKLVEFIRGCWLIGHNIYFDYDHICSMLEKLGMSKNMIGLPGLDTQLMARLVLGPEGLKKFSLKECCKYLGIEVEGVHRAMGGTWRCKEITERMSKRQREP